MDRSKVLAHPCSVFPGPVASGGGRRGCVPVGLAPASLLVTPPPDATRPSLGGRKVKRDVCIGQATRVGIPARVMRGLAAALRGDENLGRARDGARPSSLAGPRRPPRPPSNPVPSRVPLQRRARARLGPGHAGATGAGGARNDSLVPLPDRPPVAAPGGRGIWKRHRAPTGPRARS